jgi:hypothetical protein
MYVFNAFSLGRRCRLAPEIAPLTPSVGDVLQKDAIGDHLHPAAFIDGQIHRTVGFDYNEVDRSLGVANGPEDMISFSDASAALSLILQWACVRTKRGSVRLLRPECAFMLCFI